MKKTSRSHRLDSVLTEETLISDATVADLAKPSQAQKKKAKTTKREKSKEKTEILSDRELKKTFEKVSGLKVGPAVAPMLRQVHTELYEEAMETLEENTHGLPPKLGDWKDMFQQVKKGVKHLQRLIDYIYIFVSSSLVTCQKMIPIIHTYMPFSENIAHLKKCVCWYQDQPCMEVASGLWTETYGTKEQLILTMTMKLLVQRKRREDRKGVVRSKNKNLYFILVSWQFC